MVQYAYSGDNSDICPDYNISGQSLLTGPMIKMTQYFPFTNKPFFLIHFKGVMVAREEWKSLKCRKKRGSDEIDN